MFELIVFGALLVVLIGALGLPYPQSGTAAGARRLSTRRRAPTDRVRGRAVRMVGG